MFHTQYPASRCTTSDIYTMCVYAGLEVRDILRTALGSLKEGREGEKENNCVGDDFGLPL